MIYKGIVIFRPEYQFKSTGILAKFRSPVVSFCLFAGGNIVSDYILGGWLAEILPFIMVVK